jgi:hypothetical protein
MPAPINFSVAAAVRSGTFSTSPVTKQAGYTRIYWEMAIPVAAEYEDPGKSYTATLLVNGVGSDTTWQGGRAVNKQGVVDPPPAIQYDISGVPVGATLQVRMNVPVAMTIGIQNGVID